MSGDTSAQHFIKAVSGHPGSTEPYGTMHSPAASSTSTLGHHRDEQVIEMADLSSGAYWQERDPEPKHFEEVEENLSEHKQGAAHFTQEDAETPRSPPSRSGAVPQPDPVQPSQEDHQRRAIVWRSFLKNAFYLILCGLLLAASLVLAHIIEGVVEVSKDV